jgi:subtilisin family serine protease
VGPRNRVIEALVAQLAARGFIIVAAVGNDGPAARPLYPAAYPGVIGVTAVDARGRVLVEAGRGPQVDFAALGVVGSGRNMLRGTSYAAPIVAGALAQRLREPDAQFANVVLDAVRASARDLGARGRDNIYGDGLIEVRGEVAAR